MIWEYLKIWVDMVYQCGIVINNPDNWVSRTLTITLLLTPYLVANVFHTSCAVLQSIAVQFAVASLVREFMMNPYANP